MRPHARPSSGPGGRGRKRVLPDQGLAQGSPHVTAHAAHWARRQAATPWLPPKSKTYACVKLVTGPALVLGEASEGLGGMEVVAAAGDELLAQGRRTFWLDWNRHTPLALRAGESLYAVGGDDDREKQPVLTFYSPPR